MLIVTKAISILESRVIELVNGSISIENLLLLENGEKLSEILKVARVNLRKIAGCEAFDLEKDLMKLLEWRNAEERAFQKWHAHYHNLIVMSEVKDNGKSCKIRCHLSMVFNL